MKIIYFLWNIAKLFIQGILKIFCAITKKEWDDEKWLAAESFFRFCFAGLFSAVVMFSTYYIVYFLSKNYYLANVFGFILSTANSFFMNKRFVFQKESISTKNAIYEYMKSMAIYSFTGLILSNILLHIWIVNLNISELIAPIINVLIVTPLNYILNKLWTFNEKN